MNADEVRMLFDRQLRRLAGSDDPGARIERVGDVVRQVGTDGDWTGVLWSDLDETTADAAIAEQVRYFTSLGLEFEWKLYAYDRPDDLAGRLRTAGFVPDSAETVMVAEVGDLPTAVELPGGVSLLEVTDPAGVDLVAEVHEQAFGTSSEQLREQMLAQLIHAGDTVSITLAMAGDTPVSAARMELNPGTDFAGLWGGGTVAAWRGKGIYRALVAHRAALAAARGYRYLQVDASSDSRPILARLGFAPLTVTIPYLHGAGR